GHVRNRTPTDGGGSDIPGLGSWISSRSRRLSQNSAHRGAGGAGVTGFSMPPGPPASHEHPGRMEAGYPPPGPGPGRSESVDASGAIAAGNPETPPPLQTVHRRASLLHQEEHEQKEQENEQELMIGEIR
ncbi:unnamed protein product, partial [Laminaria digitata]